MTGKFITYTHPLQTPFTAGLRTAFVSTSANICNFLSFQKHCKNRSKTVQTCLKKGFDQPAKPLRSFLGTSVIPS